MYLYPIIVLIVCSLCLLPPTFAMFGSSPEKYGNKKRPPSAFHPYQPPAKRARELPSTERAKRNRAWTKIVPRTSQTSSLPVPDSKQRAYQPQPFPRAPSNQTESIEFDDLIEDYGFPEPGTEKVFSRKFRDACLKWLFQHVSLKENRQLRKHFCPSKMKPETQPKDKVLANKKNDNQVNYLSLKGVMERISKLYNPSSPEEFPSQLQQLKRQALTLSNPCGTFPEGKSSPVSGSKQHAHPFPPASSSQTADERELTEFLQKYDFPSNDREIRKIAVVNAFLGWLIPNCDETQKTIFFNAWNVPETYREKDKMLRCGALTTRKNFKQLQHGIDLFVKNFRQQLKDRELDLLKMKSLLQNFKNQAIALYQTDQRATNPAPFDEKTHSSSTQRVTPPSPIASLPAPFRALAEQSDAALVNRSEFAEALEGWITTCIKNDQKFWFLGRLSEWRLPSQGSVNQAETLMDRLYVLFSMILMNQPRCSEFLSVLEELKGVQSYCER